MNDEHEPQDASDEPAEAAPADPADADPADEVSGEDAALAALRAERDKLKDQLLRTAADFDNFRKRTKRDLEDTKRRANEDVLREILPVVDNLERALGAADTAQDIEAVKEGVRMVLRGFEEVSGRLGLSRVPALGAPFDPNVHDAIQQLETDEHEPGIVVAEVVPGYRLGERLLRAAMVVVARAKS
ncbi:MAG: nucleotide exchange factor GrpE [Sandaracinus sp.]|nr:nucleotide exchange factor GrpE [Myxococcales bacterium]MCB9600249.1 nucleotide exchange factor GrpE [Sandaracinus sp.]MCB9620158.1 nucleotide exchange factor GrpE [Sandaracinus sp.]MCB9633866.1 nucleotide exchange factor GrpE [Sandaracinus sp.]